MCKKNIDSIKGRVLLQTLPSNAYRTQETLDHARLYDREFARAGISRERYCSKIPSTGPALNAAKILSAEGIPTLGTALFGLPQAIACSQAGMLYISPYYNGMGSPGWPCFVVDGGLLTLRQRPARTTNRISSGPTSRTLLWSTPCRRVSSRSSRPTSACTRRPERSSRW